MKFDDVIVKLSVEISHLPEEKAHRILAPRQRLTTKEYLRENPSYKTSCVAVILFPDNESTHLLLMERSEGPSAHGGQISFPGGKRELDDATLLDTAMREMYEEVGIPPSEIKLIGSMSELYIPISNFLVHPFVCYAGSRPLMNLNQREVKSVLTPNIDNFLLNDIPSHRFESKSFGWIDAPYFPVDNFKVWGATAMIISELIHMLKK